MTLVGGLLFVEVAANPSWLRFFCVATPGVILSVWLIDESGRMSSNALKAVWVCIGLLAAQQTWSKHRIYDAFLNTPGGRIATTRAYAEKLAWFEARTNPGQYMLQAQWPGMYLPLALHNPMFLDSMLSPGADLLGYTTRSIDQINATRVQYIVWAHRYDTDRDLNSPFHQYLVRVYRSVWQFSDGDEVWERMTPDK